MKQVFENQQVRVGVFVVLAALLGILFVRSLGSNDSDAPTTQSKSEVVQDYVAPPLQPSTDTSSQAPQAQETPTVVTVEPTDIIDFLAVALTYEARADFTERVAALVSAGAVPGSEAAAPFPTRQEMQDCAETNCSSRFLSSRSIENMNNGTYTAIAEVERIEPEQTLRLEYTCTIAIAGQGESESGIFTSYTCFAPGGESKTSKNPTPTSSPR